MYVQSSKTSGNRNRISGFLRLFVLSLLMAAFAFTSLPAQTVAYVTNFDSNTVSVINTATNTVIATIPAGNGPNGVVVTPDNTRVFVSDFNDSTITVIDTATNTVTGTINLPIPVPAFSAITPNGKNLYVPTPSGGVLVIDTATGNLVAAIFLGAESMAAAVTPDGTRAYIVSAIPGGAQVNVIDTATNTVVGPPIPFPARIDTIFVPAVTITPDGARAYLAGESSDALSVLSTASNTISAVVPFPPGTKPVVTAITPDGAQAYVALFNTPVVATLNTSTNALTGIIQVGNAPSALAVTPDGSFVYVTNFDDSTVSVIATANNAVVATIPVGLGPVGVAFATLGPVISKCPTVITQPGTYRLANDLHCFNTDGIDIRADNVTLMLGGHTITQDSAHFGLVHQGVSVGVGLPAGSTNVQIFGPGTITGFQGGVDFEQVTNSMVKNVTSTRNFFGFNVNGGFSAGCNQACPSTGNVFRGNTTTFNNQHGFTLNGGNNNIFNANNASNNGARGILLFVATGNNVLGNTLNNNGQSGVEIAGGSGTGNTIHQNTAQNNGLVDLEDDNPNCDSNTWRQNTFGTASQTCIQ